MLLQRLTRPAEASRCAGEAVQLMAEMYPLCRSITGNGVRQTLDIIERQIPLSRFEVATGTPAFDWFVPPEWNISDAFIADAQGRRVVSFRDSNLHVVSYSEPVDRTMSLAELDPHLHSLPEHPDWIPYRTSYYKRNWGFCIRHRDRERLGPGPYHVVIRSTLEAGSLTYAECLVRGVEPGEAIVYCHTCHPSLANDNLSGIAVATLLARALQTEQPRLNWRFVFGPGTIGSLTWLARNERLLPKIRAGLTIGLLGGSQPLTFKRSRRGDTLTDRVGQFVLRSLPAPNRLIDFEPYGYDERQFCSPGFDLPVGRLTRATQGEYPEYHTSADDLSLVTLDSVAGSISALATFIGIVDGNRRLMNLSPKGEPQLGRRGLYGSLGGSRAISETENALLWILNLSDGVHDLLAIAERSRLDFALVEEAAAALERAGLARELPDTELSRIESQR